MTSLQNEELEVAAETPRQPDVVRLIDAADAYAASLYPAESNHLLDPDALSVREVRFFVARIGGRAVGCGALRIDDAGYGEIKRMYVEPDARGRKVGRLILLRIEATARAAQLTCLRLETGIHQQEALGLYRSAGYTEIGPFAAYRPDPLSIFMEKALEPITP
jgi:putative acetyltransferase